MFTPKGGVLWWADRGFLRTPVNPTPRVGHLLQEASFFMGKELSHGSPIRVRLLKEQAWPHNSRGPVQN